MNVVSESFFYFFNLFIILVYGLMSMCMMTKRMNLSTLMSLWIFFLNNKCLLFYIVTDGPILSTLYLVDCFCLLSVTLSGKQALNY